MATDIDLYETYVAGSETWITRVVVEPRLEAYRLLLEARIDIDGNSINT